MFDRGNLDTMYKGLLNDLQDQIYEARDRLFRERLDELNILVDLEAEKKNRFKKFMVCYSGGNETVYYNDGSENGLKVITFQHHYAVECDKNYGSLKVSVAHY